MKSPYKITFYLFLSIHSVPAVITESVVMTKAAGDSRCRIVLALSVGPFIWKQNLNTRHYAMGSTDMIPVIQQDR